MSKQTDSRFAAGAEIALYARIIKVKDKDEWWVFSLTDPEIHYIVTADGTCTCKDFFHRRLKCKHIWGVEIRHTVVQEVRI